MTSLPSTDTEPDLTALLHARGQRATSQRLVILRELRRRDRHATSDEIRRAVLADLPGTSAPTVYATLDLLVDLGLARRIDLAGGPALYDPRTEAHQHTLCRSCGRIDDLDHPVERAGLLRAARDQEFQADAVETLVTGLCRDCAAARPADRPHSLSRRS